MWNEKTKLLINSVTKKKKKKKKKKNTRTPFLKLKIVIYKPGLVKLIYLLLFINKKNN